MITKCRRRILAVVAHLPHGCQELWRENPRRLCVVRDAGRQAFRGTAQVRARCPPNSYLSGRRHCHLVDGLQLKSMRNLLSGYWSPPEAIHRTPLFLRLTLNACDVKDKRHESPRRALLWQLAARSAL